MAEGPANLPIICLSTQAPDLEGSEGFVTATKYIEAVRRAGGWPVILPPQDHDLELWLSKVDGVILVGGDDIDPSHYGKGPPHSLVTCDTTSTVSSDGSDPPSPTRSRDNIELRIFREAKKQKLPLLAICRGLQLVNVAEGGTLVQDIPTTFSTSTVNHVMDNHHEVQIDSGSTLCKILGTKSDIISPASSHHQCVEKLGFGIRPVAWAPDGVVEAIESDAYPEMTAVQWHPERSRGSEQIKIFEHLIKQAQERQQARLKDTAGNQDAVLQ